MKVSVAVVRTYGTDDQYGEVPRTRPPEAPLVYQDFPREGESVTVDFGPIPDEVAEANRYRRALGAAMLEGLFGVGGGDESDTSPQQRVERILQEPTDQPLIAEHNWYVTLVLQRTIEVPDDDVVEMDIFFVQNAFEIEEQSRAYAQAYLDLIATIVSTIADVGAFRNLVLDDPVLFFAEGKRPSGVPVFGISTKGHAIRGDESVALLGERLSLLAQVDPARIANEAWLGRVSYWQIQALGESDP